MSTHQTLFTGTGAPQTFVVPAGVYVLHVEILGASGGGTNVTNHAAGWGPFFTGTLDVTPGETITLQVGRGGAAQGVAPSGIVGYPDGGLGGQGPSFNKGAGGGGSSRLWRGGVGGTLIVLVAGGGGLAAFRNAEPATGLGNGLAPLGEPTINPTGTGTGTGQTGFNVFTVGGRGANLASGGAGGSFGTANGFPGSFTQGGNGRAGAGTVGVTLLPSGGGGGGGYYGGGGGASGTAQSGSGIPGGQGGGGSSFIDLSQGWTETIWDIQPPVSTITVNAGRQGQIIFRYVTPGGWALGLVSRRG